MQFKKICLYEMTTNPSYDTLQSTVIAASSSKLLRAFNIVACSGIAYTRWTFTGYIKRLNHTFKLWRVIVPVPCWTRL